MGFWLEEWAGPLVAITVFLAVVGGLIWWAVSVDERHTNAWVEACMQGEGLARYRCEERWAIAHPPSPSTTIMPVVVPVGGGR